MLEEFVEDGNFAPRELHHRDQQVILCLVQWSVVVYAAPDHFGFLRSGLAAVLGGPR